MKQDFFTAGVNGVIEGTGSHTLVMIHGWPDTQRIWEQQVAFFRQYFRCVTFNLPGYQPHARKSQAFSLAHVVDTIAKVIDFASPDQPVYLMVHDWGAIYGYQYALEFPARVSKLIGVDIGDAHSREFKKSLTPKGAALIASYQLPLVSAYRLGGRVGDRLARAVARAIKAPAPAQDIYAAMGYPYDVLWTRSCGGFSGLQPAQFAMPFFYIYGKNKPVMFHSQTWLNRIQQIPGNQVAGFDTSHWVMVDQPEQFNHRVLKWLSPADCPELQALVQ